MNRNLIKEEFDLIEWLLNNGLPNAKQYLAQLKDIKVVSQCSCGCASINFSVKGKMPMTSPMDTISDYSYYSENNNLMGVFIFARDNILAGLEVWSIDGEETPIKLPSINECFPLKIDSLNL